MISSGSCSAGAFNSSSTPTGIEQLIPVPEYGQEATVDILVRDNVRLEGIRSIAARSPDGFWYDQDEDEWITILKGHAKLRFEDEPTARNLVVGDQLLINARRRHRVEETSVDAGGTVWLCLFVAPATAVAPTLAPERH